MCCRCILHVLFLFILHVYVVGDVYYVGNFDRYFMRVGYRKTQTVILCGWDTEIGRELIDLIYV